jgi:hypothetical protein
MTNVYARHDPARSNERDEAPSAETTAVEPKGPPFVGRNHTDSSDRAFDPLAARTDGLDQFRARSFHSGGRIQPGELGGSGFQFRKW